MAIERRIRATAKDRDGNHAFFLNDGEWWSPRPRSSVIRDIGQGTYRYYVEEGSQRDYLEVVGEGMDRRLKSTDDPASPNHLDNLAG